MQRIPGFKTNGGPQGSAKRAGGGFMGRSCSGVVLRSGSSKGSGGASPPRASVPNEGTGGGLVEGGGWQGDRARGGWWGPEAVPGLAALGKTQRKPRTRHECGFAHGSKAAHLS